MPGRKARSAPPAVQNFNFFGVSIQKTPFARPQSYKIQSVAAMGVISDAIKEARNTIDTCLNNDDNDQPKLLFAGSGLPLVSSFGGKGGVLDLLNSALYHPDSRAMTSRPGVVFVTAPILDQLLPRGLFSDGNIIARDLPDDLKGFIDFFRVGLVGVLGGGRGLSRVEAPYLQLVHYLIKFDWKDTRNTDSDWLDHYADELYHYYVDLFAGKFVDRNGNTIKFDLSLSDLQGDRAKLPQTVAAGSPAVAGELLSVLVEYLGDEAFKVPFFSPAGDLPPASNPFTCYRAGIIADRLGNMLTLDHVDEYVLAGKIIASASSAAQKQVASAAGGLIRGGGIAAVNNEVLAEVIASTLGSLAKKFVEKAAFEILKGFLSKVNDNDAVVKALKSIYGVAA